MKATIVLRVESEIMKGLATGVRVYTDTKETQVGRTEEARQERARTLCNWAWGAFSKTPGRTVLRIDATIVFHASMPNAFSFSAYSESGVPVHPVPFNHATGIDQKDLL